MNRPKFNFPVQGNFIDGQFRRPSEINGEWVGRSPADFSDEVGRFQYAYTSVEEAVHSARNAFPTWRRKTVKERAEFLKKFQRSFKRHGEEFVELIAREVGKPIWDAKLEIAAVVENLEVTISESLKFISQIEIPKLIGNANGRCHYRPLGVMAVIGPFSSPVQLPSCHFFPALLTGNTIVFKPSEKTPMVGQLIAACFQEIGLPGGVFNLIQGEREVGRRLCVHEAVDGVLFTGSYEVGNRIKQDTLQQHWKLLVLEMGGKNPAIIWSDARMEVALFETVLGAFLSAGQRCTATSRIIVHEKILDEFLSRFHERSKAFSIGYPLDNPFMGPLIDHGSVDRYMKFLGIAIREGCELVMRGKSLEISPAGNYVTPSICWAKESSLEQSKKSIYQQTEFFAPNVVILSVKDLEEAIAQANATQYGLVAGVFSQDKAIYEKCLDGLDMGLVNWNKSTMSFSSRLPFGGFKKSGNHFPTGLTASTYCVASVSSLEEPEPQVPVSADSQLPGLNWEKPI